ncbi:hypothetical protein V1506DRAFT_545264 [Lipomyces tetrasporus]
MDYKALCLQEQELRKQAEERQKHAEELLQKTTFEEFIRYCHTFLSEPVKEELTGASGRLCPTYVRPRSDFHSLQQQVFDSAYRLLHPPGEAPSRLFPSRATQEELGYPVCHRPLASEADLAYYYRNTVEDQVYKAIIALGSVQAANEVFPLNDEIDFYNNLSAFDTKTVGGASNLRSLTLLYTIEYKPPHKLSTEYLRSGLREMNFWEEVVQETKIPTNLEENFRFHAEQKTGKAVAQVYNGMIQDGLAYACLTNGYCKVFFHVSEDHPETLYYFLSEPIEDVRAANDGTWFRQPITAVGRMLSFCLMSIDSIPRSESWRRDATSRLHRWETEETDSEPFQGRMSATEVHSTTTGSEHSEFIISSAPASVSSPPIETDRDLRSGHRCGPDVVPSRTATDSSDSDSDDVSPGPSNASGRKRNLSQLSSSSDNERAGGSKSRETRGGGEYRPHTSWQYCTQGCLMGLRSKGYLDVRCPNEKRHQRGQKTDRHLIDSADLVRLIKQQLDKDLDNYCTPLGKVGIRGALFKLTLFSYGYTFVGKGTTDRLWADVRTEVDVYRVLQKAHGSAVPVFLGTIDLKLTYFLQRGGCIKHMLLMSWGGEQVDLVKDEVELWDVFRQSINEMSAAWRSTFGQCFVEFSARPRSDY